MRFAWCRSVDLGVEAVGLVVAVCEFDAMLGSGRCMVGLMVIGRILQRVISYK